MNSRGRCTDMRALIRVLVCQFKNKTGKAAVDLHSETRDISFSNAQSRKSHSPLIIPAERRPPPVGVTEGATEYVRFHPVMVAFGAVLSLCYENHSFRSFPVEDLIPLTAPYGLFLDHYAAEKWTEAIEYLELSSRLRRLITDSVKYCALHGDGSIQKGNYAENQELRVNWFIMTTTSCQRKCRQPFPALQFPPARRKILQDLQHHAHFMFISHYVLLIFFYRLCKN